jgi:hypothetical protein
MTRKEKSDGHQTETPDVSHIRNVEVTHEASDVSVRGVGMFVLILTIATIVVCIGMWVLFRYFDKQEAKQRAPGPMALKQQERLPPEPRLQAAPGFAVTLEDGQRISLEKDVPQAEYRVLKEQWDKELRGELKDQNGNPVAIPIDQAINQLVNQGLPARTQTAPGKLDDYGIGVPTAWSSGREAVKLR